MHILQQMEKFKAVEKEMKTKAYSKEGLMASTRLDPMAQKKADLVNFLSDCTTELDRQIEACEAEAESLTVTLKKGKKSDNSKADRVAEVEKQVERHKWHQGKLELIMRLLENGQLDAEQVERVKDDIKFYVDSNQDVDFEEYENVYDELDLDEENAEDLFGIGADVDRMSSQDTQSIQDDLSEKPGSTKDSVVGGRRPSTQLKSPMPALATLHQVPITTNTIISNNGFPPSNGSSMKPAPLPARPAGEVLKYASVATAAAAADRNVGIAPLPPPPGMAPLPSPLNAPTGPSGMAPLPPPTASKQSSHRPGPASTPSATSPAPPVSIPHTPSLDNSAIVSPSPKPASAISVSREPSNQPPEPSPEEAAPSSIATSDHSDAGSEADLNSEDPSSEPLVESHTNDASSSSSAAQVDLTSPPVEESIYHLPPGLQDLMSSFENTKKRLVPQPGQVHRYLEYSLLNAPDTIDAEKPRHYKPTTKYDTARHYPQEPLPIFDDPLLYKRVDVDTLFYVFYYKQGTYQQYLAAKELKKQSWRFHKQYQTWFQRHEEPKTITEEYEQGTYRFFDYESTWWVLFFMSLLLLLSLRSCFAAAPPDGWLILRFAALKDEPPQDGFQVRVQIPRGRRLIISPCSFSGCMVWYITVWFCSNASGNKEFSTNYRSSYLLVFIRFFFLCVWIKAGKNTRPASTG